MVEIVAVGEGARQTVHEARGALPDSPVQEDRRDCRPAGRFGAVRQTLAAGARRLADRLDPAGMPRPPAANQGC